MYTRKQGLVFFSRVFRFCVSIDGLSLLIPLPVIHHQQQSWKRVKEEEAPSYLTLLKDEQQKLQPFASTLPLVAQLLQVGILPWHVQDLPPPFKETLSGFSRLCTWPLVWMLESPIRWHTEIPVFLRITARDRSSLVRESSRIFGRRLTEIYCTWSRSNHRKWWCAS